MFMHIFGGRKMDLLQITLWVIYPYAVVAIIGMGIIWQVSGSGEQDHEKLYKKMSLFLKHSIIGLMVLSFATGLGVILFYSISNDPEKLFFWVKSLVILEPDMDLIGSISVLSRTHLLLLLTLLLMLSLSKYIRYLWSPLFFLKKRVTKTVEESLD